MIVRVRHIRAAGLCTAGARPWFERNGLSWKLFLSDGLEASQLLKIGDPMAERAVEQARLEDYGR